MGVRLIAVSLYMTILIMSKTFDRLEHNCLLRKLRQEPIIQSGHGHTRPMSHHGVFTGWFIFEHIIEHFSRENAITRIRSTQILARVFVYLPPFISQILVFICRMVLIFILIYFGWRDTENQQYVLWSINKDKSINKHCTIFTNPY